MNNWLHRKRKRGQSIVIVALSATALFGIIALGMDAGRLYFQRRDVQNAADAGALAGAQELLPPDGNTPVTSGMQAKANCQAASYAMQNLNKALQDANNGNPSCSLPSAAYSPNSNGYIIEPSADGSVHVTVWTPSRGNTNEVHVMVAYNVPLTFAAILGFTNSTVVAEAYAHGRHFNNQYTIFGFQAGPGGGNTVQYEQDGDAQIDDGNGGSDMCNTDPRLGRMVSNSKWHAPNPNGGYLNMNGVFQHLSASDTHALYLYWQNQTNPVPVQEPAPNYEADLNVLNVLPLASPGWTDGTLKGKSAHFIHHGIWNQNLSIPFPSDPQGKDYYIFDNGLYYFNGYNLTITGGTVSNTSTGGPLTKTILSNGFLGGYTDLGAVPSGVADAGVDGVEFIFNGNGGFSANTPKGAGATSPSVFLVAPNTTPAGVTNRIVFFVEKSDTNTNPWYEKVDGTKSTAGGYPFQVWGTIFVQEPNATATIQATNAWQSGPWLSPVQAGYYTITGELASPRVDIFGGNLVPSSFSIASSPCPPNGPGIYTQQPAGLLVQFNQNYVPKFLGNSYLVK